MKYVAFLRGINVGGNKKVEMKKLKTLIESLGYTNVSTYINSGNVIFETNERRVQTIAKKIEALLAKQLGFEVRVVVRDKANMQNLVKAIPRGWSNDEHQKSDILFLWDKFDSKTSLRLIAQTSGIDSLIYVPGAILWNIDRSKYSKSGMHKFIGTVLYKHMTARNVNTVRKLAELMG